MHWNNTNITQVVTPNGIDTWLNGTYEAGTFFNVSATLDDPLHGYVVAKMVKKGGHTLTTAKYPASGDKRARAIGWKNLFPKNGKFLGAEQNCFWEILYIKRPGQSGHFNENIQSFTEPGKRISGCVLCLVPIAWENSDSYTTTNSNSCFLGMAPGEIIPEYYRSKDNENFLEIEVGDVLSAQKMHRLSCPDGCLGSFEESLGTLHLCFYGKDSSVPEQVLSDDLDFDGIKITDLPEIKSINDNHKFLVYYTNSNSLIPESINHIFSPNLKTVFFNKSIKITSPPYSLSKVSGSFQGVNWYWNWSSGSNEWIKKSGSVNGLEWFYIDRIEREINKSISGVDDSKIQGYIISVKTRLLDNTYEINSKGNPINISDTNKETSKSHSYNASEAISAFIIHDNKSSETRRDGYDWYDLQGYNGSDPLLLFHSSMYDENIPFTKKISFAQLSGVAGKGLTGRSLSKLLARYLNNERGDTDFTCGSEQFILGSAGDTFTTLAIAFTRDYSVPAKRRFILDICCDGYIIEK